MKNTFYVFLVMLFILGLQGCSPHPGAGHWQAVENTDSRFSKITVEFEGRAEMLPADKLAETQRCFWAGKTSDTIQLQCTHGDDSGVEILYLLRVDSSGNEPIASLTLGGKQIGSYRGQLE